MDYSTVIVAVLGVAAAAGGIAAWFSRSRGTDTVKLLQANIDAYKDSEKLKDARIFYLEGQLVVKDETIKRLIANDRPPTS